MDGARLGWDVFRSRHSLLSLGLCFVFFGFVFFGFCFFGVCGLVSPSFQLCVLYLFPHETTLVRNKGRIDNSIMCFVWYEHIFLFCDDYANFARHVVAPS
jgi:hypothetical protein